MYWKLVADAKYKLNKPFQNSFTVSKKQKQKQKTKLCFNLNMIYVINNKS